MKQLFSPRFLTTSIFRLENNEDLGLKEIVGYIKHVMEDINEQTVNDEWVKKFKKIDISFVIDKGEEEDSRFNHDILFVDINKELVLKLKEVFNGELSKYPVEFKEIQETDNGILFIRFIKTVQ